MTLWTFDAMAEAMNADVHAPGAVPDGVSGLSIDTRTLRPGEAYFAIRGDVHDGHDFVQAAREAGAGLAVVSRDRARAAGAMPLLVVDDTLAALERLGRAARARTDALVVAVTGSVGKTTTKELLRAVLAPSGTVHAAVASFNNHWGVPLTLARMPRDARYAVIEIGMNHPGEITPLVRMARPHAAIITLVAGAHMGAFASIDDIARAKAEIFDGLDAHGVAILNANDPRFELLRAEAERRGIRRIVTFGDGRAPEEPDVILSRYDAQGGETAIAFDMPAREVSARIGATGRHIAMNAAAAMTCALLFEADLDAAANALAGFSAGKGRGERHVLQHPEGPIELIDESYNANPASMRAAIASLRAATPGERPDGTRGRRIAILGDMLELGDHSPRMHEALAGPLERGVDAVWLVGPEMAVLAERLRSATPRDGEDALDVRHFGETPQLATIVADEVRGHDVVMVKSSLGLRFATLVDALLAAHPPAPAEA